MTSWNISRSDRGGETNYVISSLNLDFVDTVLEKGGPNDSWKQGLGKRDLTTNLKAVRYTINSTGDGGGTIHIEPPEAPWLWYKESYRGTLPYVVDPFWPDVGTHLSDRISETATKLASKCYQAQRGSFAGGQFLGEIAETIHLIKHPFEAFCAAMKSIAPAWKSYNRKLFRPGITVAERNRILHDWSSLYLQWTFGVIPLISDVHDLVKRVHELSRRRTSQRVTAGTDDSGMSSSSTGVCHAAGWDANYTVGRPWSITCRGAAQVNFEAEEIGYNPSHFGLRLQDFVPTVWELIPFSFIVDYWSNVGEFIESTMAEFSLIPWKYVTYEQTRSVVITPSIVLLAPPESVKSFNVTLPPVSVTEQVVGRVRIGWSDELAIFTTLPRIKQFTNMGAVIAQLFT